MVPPLREGAVLIAVDGYPAAGARVPVGEVAMAVVDEGPRDGPVVVCLHGEPTWGFLYRHVLADLVTAGARVVVPDLIGFGRSDKPPDVAAYTYAGHVRWLEQALFGVLDLRHVVLVCQDWGGLLGLRLAAQRSDRFAAIVAANTFLPFGGPLPQAFLEWRAYVRATPGLDVGEIVQRGSATRLAPEIVDAYRAPFVTAGDLAGVRAFPDLVPDRLDHPEAVVNRAAWEVLRAWDKPFLTAFSDGDPITAGGAEAFQALVPGAAGAPHRTLHGGHFLQEDAPHELAAAVLDAIELMQR